MVSHALKTLRLKYFVKVSLETYLRPLTLHVVTSDSLFTLRLKIMFVLPCGRYVVGSRVSCEWLRQCS
jgi:hypothetical protein